MLFCRFLVTVTTLPLRFLVTVITAQNVLKVVASFFDNNGMKWD